MSLSPDDRISRLESAVAQLAIKMLDAPTAIAAIRELNSAQHPDLIELLEDHRAYEPQTKSRVIDPWLDV